MMNKGFRRFFAAAVTIMLLVVFSAPSMLAEVNTEREYSYTDIDNSKYRLGIQILSDLGITGGYDDGTFRPDDKMTRAEFVQVILRLINVYGVRADNKTAFEDVPERYWNSDEIYYAVSAGIINGYDESHFGPDDTILYEQAIKVIVDILGYAPVANMYNSYPDGYINVAMENNITKHIDKSKGEALTRGEVAQMIFNATDVSIITADYGAELAYKKREGVTILDEKFQIKRYEGIITGTSLGGLHGISNVPEGMIEIDGKMYEIGVDGIEQYLGYSLYYYLKTDGTEETVVSYELKAKENTVLSIPAELISDVRIDAKQRMIVEYYPEKDSSREKKVYISDVADYIYNGQAELSVSTQDLIITKGRIVLLDNNNDNEYDIVYIYSYDTYVINNVSADTKVITDRYGKPNLELDENKYDVKITFNGEEVPFSELKSWDVLSVAIGKNGERKPVEIILCRDVVKGAASSVSSDEIVIDGVIYEIAADCTETFYLNTDAVFYLDHEGRIAGVDYNAGKSDTYAYLVKAYYEDEKGYVKLFSDGKVWEYELSEKTKLDGKRFRTEEIFDDEKFLFTEDGVKNTLFDDNGAVVKQLVRYKLAKDGKITELDTPQKMSGETSKSLSSTGVLNSSTYIMDGATFGEGAYAVMPGVKVFVIPDKDDIESYFTSGNFFEDGVYTVELFNVTDMKTTDLIVCYDAGGTVTSLKEAPFLIVKSVDKILDENDEVAVALSVTLAGSDKRYICSEAAESAALKLNEGDIIQCQMNRNDTSVIETVNVRYKNDAENAFFETTNVWDYARVIIGQVVATEDDRIVVSTQKQSNGAIDKSVGKPYSLAGVTVQILRNGKAEKASAADCMIGSTVVLRASRTQVREAVIIR